MISINDENHYLDLGPLSLKSCERLVKDIEQMKRVSQFEHK